MILQRHTVVGEGESSWWVRNSEEEEPNLQLRLERTNLVVDTVGGKEELDPLGGMPSTRKLSHQCSAWLERDLGTLSPPFHSVSQPPTHSLPPAVPPQALTL